MPDLPADYVVLDGSERHPSPGAAVTGPADPGETFTVSIVLRRRPGGPPVPDFSHYARTPRMQRRRLSHEDFAARYGAADDDIAKVDEFVTSHGLHVVETDTAARTVKASGTVPQMSEAFAVALQTYEHEVTPRPGQGPVRESYRGRDVSSTCPGISPLSSWGFSASITAGSPSATTGTRRTPSRSQLPRSRSSTTSRRTPPPARRSPSSLRRVT